MTVSDPCVRILNDDQYTYTCCAGEHNGQPCLVFYYCVGEEGRALEAFITSLPRPVPADEVAVYSRAKAGEVVSDVS